MIALFSDFGSQDVYVGQVKASILRHAPEVPIVDLLHDAPSFAVLPAAHLLPALARQFAPETVFFCVIDPGVGGAREGTVLRADGKWFVGPDNGLLSVVAARASEVRHWRIAWRPDGVSPSFHGRDLFAPVCAWLALGQFPEDRLEVRGGLNVQFEAGDLAEIVYIDHYGNAMTGLRGNRLGADSRLRTGSRSVGYARVFSEVAPGQAFWYRNSIGLVEIAVNRDSAARLLGLAVGTGVRPLAD